jgi:archaellum component FlaF (FlaF/FlaG flagellin family)
MGMRSLASASRRLAALGGVAVVAAVLAMPAFGATGSYAATSSSTVGAGTTEATSSTPASLTVTLTNRSSSSSSYKLGSANITFPGCVTSPCAAGFALQQGTMPPADIIKTGGANWSAKVVGNVVQIRTPETSSNYLAPGKSLTVTVKATAAPTKTGQYALTTVAKDDGDYDGSTLTATGSASIKVTPGPLNSFAWTRQADAAQKAGVQVTSGGSATVSGEITAYDVYSNVDTDYVGSHGTLSGLGTAPSGRGPDGMASPPAFGLGVASVSVTGYKAETTHLTFVADAKPAVSTSPDFTVAPGDLDSFKWTKQPDAAQKGSGHVWRFGDRQR